jgi:hypothetical protein
MYLINPDEDMEQVRDLQKVMENMTERPQLCTNNKGGHFHRIVRK